MCVYKISAKFCHSVSQTSFPDQGRYRRQNQQHFDRQDRSEKQDRQDRYNWSDRYGRQYDRPYQQTQGSF